VLGPLVTIANPLDYHTFIWGDGPRTTEVFTTMLSGYDAGIFIIDPPRPDRCDPSSSSPRWMRSRRRQAARASRPFPWPPARELRRGRADAMMAAGWCR
jgi:acetate---CoA ligase (ADP-forming)